MFGVINDAFDVYREEGTWTLLRKAAGFGCDRAAGTARSAYWGLRGTRPFTVAGVTATFDTSNRGVVGRTSAALDRERAPLAAFLRRLRPGDTVWDVGANVGLYTGFVAAALDPERGRVVAFEPYDPNADLLERNAGLNQAPVDVHRLALSDADGHVAFSHPDEDTVGAGLPAISDDRGAASRTEAARGDTLVSAGRAPAPTAVKIDVEGAEPLVVEGLDTTLRTDPPRVLLVEIHHSTEAIDRDSIEEYGDSVDAFEARLESFGYEVAERFPRPRYDDEHVLFVRT
ncbi:MAG: FkbM family methyltransferase [Haloarculaceae archaeon]